MALKIVVNCDVLKLEESFNGTHFGCAFSKTCQYVTIEEKICKDLKFVSIKLAESDIHKCITWFQFLEKEDKNGPRLVLMWGFNQES